LTMSPHHGTRRIFAPFWGIALSASVVTGRVDAQVPHPPAPASPRAAAARPAQRPKSKQVVLMLEGQPEKVTFTLFDGRRVPVPCPTYGPADIVGVDTTVPGGGHVIRFVAQFAGKRNENAYLQVGSVPRSVTETKARELARRIAARRGQGQRPAGAPRRFAWSL